MAAHQLTADDAKSAATLHKGPILTVLILGAFVALLNQTLLNVAIPHLMNAFGVSADTVQWLSTVYMLTNGVLIPITAFLIGTFSTRQLFIFAMSSFALGSIICAVAPDFSIMMIGRVVQGAGAGIMMPLMMTVILNMYPPESRGKAMGTIAIAMFFAPAIGPTLSGWMIVHWSWRLLFTIVIPIAVVDIILAVALLKNVTDRTRPKFDMFGFITSVIGFSTLLYGFSEAGSNGWGSTDVVVSLALGVIFLALFVVAELTAKNPMLDLSVFKYSRFTVATIVSCVVNMALYGGMLLSPIYLQNIRGFTALESGLVLLPGALLMGIMSPITGALFDRIGVRPLAIIGLTITAITTWQLTKLTGATTLGHFTWIYTFRMFGMSFISMTIMTSSLNALPRHLNAHGTASSNTAKQIAASIGTALLITVMTDRTKVHFADFANTLTSSNPFFAHTFGQLGAALSSQLGQPMQVGQGVMGQLLYGMAMKQATIDGINDAFMVATVITIIALILSFFLNPPAKKVLKREEHPAALRPESKRLVEVEA